MGRCDVAPTVCVGKNYVDHATAEKVIETIKKKILMQKFQII